MKKIKLFSIFVLQFSFFSIVNSQGFVNNGEIFHIEEGASIFVDGSFENKINSQFSNDGTVTITGNIKNQQTMPYFSLGTWLFSGTTSQRFTGGVEFDMKNIVFNNPAGFTIGVPTSLKIHGSASFIAGVLGPVSSTYPIIFNDGSKIDAIAQPTNASHINGTVLKDGLGIFTFPIGNGLIYAPFTTNLTENSKGFMAKYVETNIGIGNFVTTGTDPTPLIGYNSSEYWDIGPLSGGTATGTVKLFWDGQNETLNNSGYSYRKVAHKVGGDWLNEGTNGVGNETSGSVTSNEISSWSPFTVGYIQATALPITLISFTGKKVGNYNQLNWQTSSEINASHFEVERSSPLTPGGGNSKEKFEKIGQLKTSESKNYEFHDQTPPSGVGGLYRLKLIDLDGQFAYSKIIYLENLADNEIVGAFYPNTAMDNKTSININAVEKSEWEISQMNGTGVVLSSQKIILEKGQNKIEIHLWSKGLNLVQFKNKNVAVIRKVLN